MFENTEINPITVLGKTFNTEEERREYFREELRKHLPELKKMEGFPIGEDDDIINLSDPPYYTACPNPWLNDFIAEWEQEKSPIRKEVNVPYPGDVSEGKNNTIYTAHSYHTKVPHFAVMRYLMHYTCPGDIVLDSFAGTGMTGVAGQFCGTPDIKTKTKFEFDWQEEFEEKPHWGDRKVIMGDLSPLASFIAYNYNVKLDEIKFAETISKILLDIKSELSWMYETNHSDGRKGIINYTVWSEVFSCGNCNGEIIFWNQAVDEENSEVKSNFKCSHCSSLQTKKTVNKYWVTEFDQKLGESIKKVKTVPTLIHYSVDKKRFLKTPDLNDLETIQRIKDTPISNYYPIDEFQDGVKTVELIRAGLTHVNHVYTTRNLHVLSLLYAKLPLQLKVVFTALLNRSSRMVMTVMSNYFAQQKGRTVGGWAGKPMNGTLYAPSISTEVSVLQSILSRQRSLLKLQLLKKNFNNANFSIGTFSATDLNISDEMIDYIFTDPPFGANIMYSELNYIAESWLKVKTNNVPEAIENKKQNKSLLNYQILMTKSFREYYRVLKPGKWMTVEFSNTSAAVWNGIRTAIQMSGFVIANVSALDKKQGSFNAVNNPTSVKQDLVISCYKPSSTFDEKFKQHHNAVIAVWDFVDEHLHHLPIHLTSGNSTTAIIERSPKILFDRLIAFYVQKGLPVPIDAGKFQQGLRERFIERDGMFFTNEQVQEYDRKKKENPEFVQFSILVSSEQDGVFWLKNLLLEKSLVYQDIMPLWMQALAGVRKGDVIPELATILEENFLKDENNKWYAPDPENEADLEKLRTKRLLRQFDAYKVDALKPKTKKIKEVRVEALRAGFKQCYQDKDFKSIVIIGDKIPNNLLMEDEVLLQFYDIASSRV